MVTATKPDPPRLFQPSPAYSPLRRPFHFQPSTAAAPPLPGYPLLATHYPLSGLTPLESALTDSCARKSFRIRSYEETYGGHPPPNQTNENNRGPICIAEPITPALSTSHPAVSTAPAMAAAACP